MMCWRPWLNNSNIFFCYSRTTWSAKTFLTDKGDQGTWYMWVAPGALTGGAKHDIDIFSYLTSLQYHRPFRAVRPRTERDSEQLEARNLAARRLISRLHLYCTSGRRAHQDHIVSVSFASHSLPLLTRPRVGTRACTSQKRYAKTWRVSLLQYLLNSGAYNRIPTRHKPKTTKTKVMTGVRTLKLHAITHNLFFSFFLKKTSFGSCRFLRHVFPVKSPKRRHRSDQSTIPAVKVDWTKLVGQNRGSVCVWPHLIRAPMYLLQASRCLWESETTTPCQ